MHNVHAKVTLYDPTALTAGAAAGKLCSAHCCRRHSATTIIIICTCLWPASLCKKVAADMPVVRTCTNAGSCRRPWSSTSSGPRTCCSAANMGGTILASSSGVWGGSEPSALRCISDSLKAGVASATTVWMPSARWRPCRRDTHIASRIQQHMQSQQTCARKPDTCKQGRASRHSVYQSVWNVVCVVSRYQVNEKPPPSTTLYKLAGAISEAAQKDQCRQF